MGNQIKFYVPFGGAFILAGLGALIGGVSVFFSGDHFAGVLLTVAFGLPFGGVGAF